MKPRERFVTALNMGIPDRVPIFEFLFSPKLQEKYVGQKTPLYDGGVIMKLATKLGIDAVAVFVGGYAGFEFEPYNTNTDTFVDDWGIKYHKNGWPVMVQTDTIFKDRKDWEKYEMPDPKAPWRAKQVKDAIRENTDELAIIPGLLGPVTLMYWHFMDLPTLSTTLLDDPRLIDEICDTYVDWVKDCTEEIIKTGKIDAFLIGDDWGFSSSLLISPETIRKHFIKPFAKMVKVFHDLGYPVVMHNDGNLWEVLDDIANTGINGYHPVEKAATMDLAIIKKKYKTLCPIGNVNNKTTMVTGSPEDVKKETIECLKIGAPGGGYIIASDHSLHDDVPEENFLTLIKTAKKHGKYPLEL